MKPSTAIFIISCLAATTIALPTAESKPADLAAENELYGATWSSGRKTVEAREPSDLSADNELYGATWNSGRKIVEAREPSDLTADNELYGATWNSGRKIVEG